MKKLFLTGMMTVFFLGVLSGLNAQIICENSTGSYGAYVYELWRDTGESCMTLGEGQSFTVNWIDNNLMLSKMGMWPGSVDSTINYTIELNSTGPAWLGIYGRAYDRTTGNMVEYYIIDSWSYFKPPGNGLLGTYQSDGAVYEIYRLQSSLLVNSHYQEVKEQYYSVRKTKRTRGYINIADHLRAFSMHGLKIDHNIEVSVAVGAYQSSGNAKVTLYFGSCCATPTAPPTKAGDVNSDSKIDIVDALLVTQFYVGVPILGFIETKADVNHDGEITIIDALLIAQCYVGQKSCDF